MTKKVIGSLDINIGNGNTRRFNLYENIDIDIDKPCVAIYQNDNSEMLGVEFVQDPVTHFQNFNPKFIDEIFSTLIWQTYQDVPSHKEIVGLKSIASSVKREYTILHKDF